MMPSYVSGTLSNASQLMYGVILFFLYAPISVPISLFSEKWFNITNEHLHVFSKTIPLIFARKPYLQMMIFLHVFKGQSEIHYPFILRFTHLMLVLAYMMHPDHLITCSLP